jgi:sec-independent protein translocase protein TatC
VTNDDALTAMPLMDHLRELRNRLIYAAGAVVVGMLASLVIVQPVAEGLTRMCTICTFVYSRPTESFTTYFRVALVLGLVVATPVVLYQLVSFVLPGLHRNERRYLFLLLPGAAVLFALGLGFAYFVVLPRSVNFLASFQVGLAQPYWTLSNYLAFVTNLMFIIGVAFQTPLVVFVLAKLGIVSAQGLSKYRRHAVLILALVAAILTPTPDPFTMFLVLAPMWVLYEFGILLARLA